MYILIIYLSSFSATDINPIAIETTLLAGAANGLPATAVLAVKTDLVDGLKQSLRGRVDLLVTNPPFEPSEENDVGTPGAMCAWCAGPLGRALIDRILPELTALMAPTGLFLMNCCVENRPDEIREVMANLGFFSEVVIHKHGTTSSNFNRTYEQFVLAFSKTSYWTKTTE